VFFLGCNGESKEGAGGGFLSKDEFGLLSNFYSISSFPSWFSHSVLP